MCVQTAPHWFKLIFNTSTMIMMLLLVLNKTNHRSNRIDQSIDFSFWYYWREKWWPDHGKKREAMKLKMKKHKHFLSKSIKKIQSFASWRSFIHCFFFVNISIFTLRWHTERHFHLFEQCLSYVMVFTYFVCIQQSPWVVIKISKMYLCVFPSLISNILHSEL